MAENTQIYIRGFPRSTRQQQLKKAFSGYGDIKEIKMLGSYAFITYVSPDDASEAVKSMQGSDFDGEKLKVEIAGKPKRLKGPQPDDVCRLCGKQGHWKNGCPSYKRDRRGRKRHSRSQSSSSSSQSRDRHKKSKKKKKSKKISKRSKKRSPSSGSYSSSSPSSQSSRSSSQSEKDRKSKRKQKEKEKEKDKQKQKQKQKQKKRSSDRKRE